ncbi:zinc finger protein [Plasmodium brasilianum]|uniref:Zinc finger protein n=1 Tax=Plasmodium brasilianum TaxID=5824 RepID=A0ACB9Y3R0_PLABR|nr:zinc finger protein [Plasmodium brasilianum]
MNLISPAAKYVLSNINKNGNLKNMSEEKYNDIDMYLYHKESINDPLINLKQETEDRMHSDIYSDICRTVSSYTDYTTKKVKYVVNKRFSELENIEKNIEDIDYTTFRYFRTLPPKYSDENDLRNNIIFNSNNIYIYAENKNGTLNEQACISISPDNNVIYCSTKGRRYTIGGHAGIQKNINNEYNFFEDNNLASPHDSIKTYTFDAIDSSDISSSFTKMNLIKTNDALDESNTNKIDTENIFNENVIMNSCSSSILNTTKCIPKNMSVQKLFNYYKNCSQNLEHEQRVCKPCAHVYNGSTCMNGDECSFCHHPDHVLISAKKWKKLVKNNLEKLNILLHILRNPNDINANILNEMLKQNTKTFKKSKKLNNSNSKMMNINSSNISFNISSNVTNNINSICNVSNNNSNNFHNIRRNKNNKNKIYHFPHKNTENMIRYSYNNYESNETADTYKKKFHVRNSNMNVERNLNFLSYHVNM